MAVDVASTEAGAEELAGIYATATLVVARSGAGTVNECCQLGLPALYIPMPGASGDEQTANARLVERVVRVSGTREAQIMVGHPNNSGLQMDQLTQLYVPAYFINELRLWQDDSLILSMEGGISISEDPNIRFTYVSNGAKQLRAEAKDTEGRVFQREWKVEDSGM